MNRAPLNLDTATLLNNPELTDEELEEYIKDIESDESFLAQHHGDCSCLFEDEPDDLYEAEELNELLVFDDFIVYDLEE